ncbi:MAG: periplasmic heavy metal sensor [Desulfobacterales bacterium]|jgi:Spy/CpxP family protein refolding chaperone
MKRNTLYIIGIALLVSIAAAYAFAHGPGWSWDRGYGHIMGPDGWGPGWHHNGGHGYNQERYYGNLSADEIAKLDQQRSEFFKATENIRQKLNEKELALRNELAKDDLDTNKTSKLQSEISKLQSNLDQERLNYEIRARKSVPNYNRGHGGYGMMMGYGHHGGGYCWR